MDRPNILLVITDQQSATMLSCAGNPHLKTPALDRLAAQGVRFERAYCTNPVCVASRTSLLSGRMPGEFHGIQNIAPWRAPEGWTPDQTLGNLLRAAGYRTYYAGKVHVPKPLIPADAGFEYLCDDERDELADVCSAFLRNPPAEPFFLIASFINPHDICYHGICDFPVERTAAIIRNSPVEIATMREARRLPEGMAEDEFYDTVCPPLPANHACQEHEPEAVSEFIARRKFQVFLRERWTDRDWRLHRWCYCRLAERVDAQIGRVLDALDEGGARENTLVVATSDHGDHDGSHMLEHKSLLYEEAVRIPLIVRYPGHVPEGAVDTGHLVSNGMDLLPTLCDYAGASVPSAASGLSLRPLLEGNAAAPWREDLYLEGEMGFGVVSDRYKYVLYNDGRGSDDEQLYDRVLDPGEMRNDGRLPENAAALARGRERLLAYQTRLYGGRRTPADFDNP